MVGWVFLGTVFPHSSLSTCSPSSPGQPYAGSGREDLGLQPGRGEVAEATGTEKYDPTQFEPPGSSKVTRDFRGTTADVRTRGELVSPAQHGQPSLGTEDLCFTPLSHQIKPKAFSPKLRFFLGTLEFWPQEPRRFPSLSPLP